MKDSVIDRISQRPQELKPDNMLMKHDIKIMELSIRVDQLENVLVKIQQKYPAFWDGKE